jgi:hypothetical protein
MYTLPHLDIKREGIYTGILQPVKVFNMLVGIDDLDLDIKREGIYTDILQPHMWKTLTV